MSKEQKQRDILFEACKKIATNKRTPDWISGALTQAVMAAKAVPDDDDIWNESLDAKQQKQKIERPVTHGCVAHVDTLDNTPYKIKVLQESETVEGIKLWHVQILDGKGPHAIGSIVYNMPETWIYDVEG